MGRRDGRCALHLAKALSRRYAMSLPGLARTNEPPGSRLLLGFGGWLRGLGSEAMNMWFRDLVCRVWARSRV